MRGNTYDAKHLDNFLMSPFGEQSVNIDKIERSKSTLEPPPHLRHRSLYKNVPQFSVDHKSIKPSVSFINLDREQTKFTDFIDLKEGPSSLQKRPSIPTTNELNPDSYLFERERVTHQHSLGNKLGQL